MNNMKTINAVKSGETPKYWETQQRCYMELLDADFSCIFLGWGNRPGLDTNAMHRIERDRDLGESILEQTEDFMVGNVEAGVKPSYRNVKSYERVVESIEEIYGPVNPKAKPVKLDKKFKKNLEELKAAMDAIEEAKAAEKLAKEKVEEAQRRFEELQLPIIEELKTSPKGEFVDADGTHYDVTYNVRNALDVDKVKTLYPAAYDECNKPAIDTKTLKRVYPEIYTECFGPKVGGKRAFSLDIWKRRS
jgi:predicted phage-related endonuclease